MTGTWYDIVIFICVTIMLMIPCGAISYFADKASCSATANALGYTSHYTLLTGCIIEKPDGRRVLLEQIRDVGISKEDEE